jgi:Ni,Fe-hydrogenase maturation factor
VRSVFQLAPELAAEIAEAALVVFVDASVDLPPGKIAFARLAAGGPAAGPLGHHAAPGELLALTAAVFGRAPPAWLVQIGARSFDLGQPLSPEVERAVARIEARLRRLFSPRRAGR